MKSVIAWTGAIIFVLVIFGGIIFTGRFLSNVSTPITVHKPVENVTCAVAATSDGVAISCWKD